MQTSLYKIRWWSYIHSNGTLQVKRYFGPDDIFEASESPFVNQIFGPFEAKNRTEAVKAASDFFQKNLRGAAGQGEFNL